MATRSEIRQAIGELAFLDPTSLLKAMEADAGWATAAWEEVLPPDATFAEIKKAGLEFHKAHPGWEIRAGEIAARIVAGRAEKRRREESERLRKLNENAALEKVPMPPELKKKLGTIGAREGDDSE